MKVGVVGAGAWGTALAICAARGGADVVMWSYDGICAKFDGVDMPKGLHITTDMSDLRGMDIWLVVTPAAYFDATLRRAHEFYDGAPVLICTKGADPESGEFTSDILCRVIPECREYGVLSGPQFAAEVARNIPTGSTIAGTPTARRAGRAALHLLELDDSDDVIGAQICGVGKNAVALICGYNSIAADGENERALMFTRAWGDVVRLGLAMGAELETFMGLCGIGDLFLSATSETSRNFSGGMALARGEDVVGTVEGIYALRGLVRRATELGVDVPTLRMFQEKMKI